MQTIYVIYKSDNHKNHKVKYDIFDYQADTIVPIREGSPLHTYFMQLLGRSPKSRYYPVEFLYQNIERSECIKYLEMRYGVKENQLGVYINI